MTSHDNLRTHVVLRVQGFSSGRSRGERKLSKTRTFCIAGNFGTGNIFCGLPNPVWEFLLFDEQSSTYSEFPHSKVYCLERRRGREGREEREDEGRREKKEGEKERERERKEGRRREN